jgi:hypothetical protein
MPWPPSCGGGSPLPSPGTSDLERQRLRTRMEQLRKQNEWADLLAIPEDAEKVVQFDRHRLVIQSLNDLTVGHLDALQEQGDDLLDRLRRRGGQHVPGWLPTGPAEPFFDSASLSPWRPRTVPGERASHQDPLAWYAGAA